MARVFTTIIGIFVTDDNFVITKHIQFENVDEYNARASQEKVACEKYGAKKATLNEHKRFLEKLRKTEYLKLFQRQNTALTIGMIKDSINEDNLINQAINNIEEVDKTVNILVKRLREWVELTVPEYSESMPDHESFVRGIMSKNRGQMLHELKLREEESMGTELSDNDVGEMLLLAGNCQSLFDMREQHKVYLDSIMVNYTPNLLELCGVTIAAKLIEHTGSLRRLAFLPSSTVQLIGAEKALFRHLTRKARSPKHGLIINHPIVQKAKREDRGKAARALADKISVAARLDFFKGEFMAKDMLRDLEGKFQNAN